MNCNKCIQNTVQNWFIIYVSIFVESDRCRIDKSFGSAPAAAAHNSFLLHILQKKKLFCAAADATVAALHRSNNKAANMEILAK